MKLVKEIFTLCKCFPIQDSLALQDQLKRCSISIPSNIAEGASKISSIEYIHLYCSKVLFPYLANDEYL